MKKLLIIMLFISTLSGCTQKNSQTNNDTQETQSETEQSQSEIDKEIAELKRKYSAIDFDTDDIEFSVELTDNYKGHNLYAELFSIDDVFRSDGELFMYASDIWNNDHFLLKITPEQYNAIQPNHTSLTSWHTIFKLDNVEPMIPSVNGNFSFDIYAPDDISVDEDAYLSFDSRIIYGELVDMTPGFNYIR